MPLQFLLNSILSSLLLCLAAAGFNLIFNATKVFHFAHGAIYALAVYACYSLLPVFGSFTPWLATLFSILGAVAIVAALAVIIEYLVYRPLYKKDANSTNSLISSLGVFFLITNLITFYFGTDTISLNKDFTILISNSSIKITSMELIQLVCGVLLTGLLILFSKSGWYTNIRAISYSYPVAEKFGINVQQTRYIALIAGSILAAAAAILKGYEAAIEPGSGLTIVLTSSVAVIIGGVHSLRGTFLACFIIGFVENYSVKFLSAEWKEMFIYILLLIVLLYYKKGLISTKQRIETK